MKISLEITRKKVVFTGIIGLISVLSYFLAGISVFQMCLFPLLYFVVTVTEIELKEKWNWFVGVPIFAAGSYLTTWMVQYLLLEEDLRGKISDEKFYLNVLCCLFCYMFVQTIVNNVALACTIAHIGLIFFAGINYFVYGFRGNEIIFGDLKSISTGLSVAANYQFSLNSQAMNVILLTAVWVALVQKFPIQFKRVWLARMFSASIAVLVFVYVGTETVNTVTETWEQKGTYRNGFLLNFSLSIRDSFVEKPEHYSLETVERIEEGYAGEEESKVAGVKPTIIAIMDESFADLGAMGDLKTNRKVMPFIESLTENAIYGKAIASVYGAKTPNSEWEFMTGNSMAWLPAGSVAYQQYFTEDNAYSMVDTLKKQGYTCVAMHPYYETGWSRNKVYPKLGFDEMYFLDDFDQTNLIREYVSDASMFDKVIERYEEGKDSENLFIMGVTMQNHGGYRDTYDNFVTDIYSTNIPYADVNQYLTLAHRTDLAVEKLISYFEKVREPVVICFFGDHQPSLNTNFYRMLNGKGLSGLTLSELEELFEVPFFIWTNYPSESQYVEHTSLNFLSTMLLMRAGVELPAYNRFLYDLMQEIPAMNCRAFYSNTLNRYLHFEDATGEDAVWLEKYRILQYNGLFEKKGKSEVFFGR